MTKIKRHTILRRPFVHNFLMLKFPLENFLSETVLITEKAVVAVTAMLIILIHRDTFAPEFSVRIVVKLLAEKR